MARLARFVIPAIGHHVTQRGNWPERVFFEDNDYRAHLSPVAVVTRGSGNEIWGNSARTNGRSTDVFSQGPHN